MGRAINWARYDWLKAQGHSERNIAGALGIPRTTLRRAIATPPGYPRAHQLNSPPRYTLVYQCRTTWPGACWRCSRSWKPW